LLPEQNTPIESIEFCQLLLRNAAFILEMPITQFYI
jgi:hypothetical protein